MASSSSSSGTVSGMVILVNAYLSKLDPDRFLAVALRYDSPLQAYIVHSDKQGLSTNARLWDRASNTLGLVLASCEIEQGAGISQTM